MNRKRYEQTADYQKSLEIVRKFIDEVLDGDIEKLRNFCFEDLATHACETDFIGDIADPDMYLITQAIYIILWGDIYNLTFEKMGSWNWKNEYAYRGDTMNSFGSIFGKENLESGKEFAFRAKFYGADKKTELWKRIEDFYKTYHYIGNFIVIPNRGSVKNGINGARAGFYDSKECEGMRDYFDWFLIALYKYQMKVLCGNINMSKFELQLQMNPEYSPRVMDMKEWEERFFLSPYYVAVYSNRREPERLFKTQLDARLKVTDPNGNDPEKSYFQTDEYLELMEDYIDKSNAVIEYRTNKIIEELKEKVIIKTEAKAYDIMDLPKTYEEYAKLNNFGEMEMSDEFAPLAKKYYETAAMLINKFEPFTKEEAAEIVEYEELGDSFRENFDLLLEYGHITNSVRFVCEALFDEMEACPDEQFEQFGFIYDLFEEWFEECRKA